MKTSQSTSRKTGRGTLTIASYFGRKSENDLNAFHTTINNLHESIQFTMESNTSKLSFLDILIIKEGNKIITDLYCKPTDTHQYLDFRSCHPPHTKRNILFNLARRIVSENNVKDLRLTELKTYLRRQHYPESIINTCMGIQKAKLVHTAELRQTRERGSTEQDNIPFVVTHNPRNHNILYSAKRFRYFNNQQTWKN